MSENNYYFQRFLARLFDFMFIELLVIASGHLAPQSVPLNPVIWFLVYNLTVVLVRGQTLGKYAMDLFVDAPKKSGRFNLICREILFLLLLPLLLLNVLCGSRSPLHDRICRTKVKKHEY